MSTTPHRPPASRLGRLLALLALVAVVAAAVVGAVAEAPVVAQEEPQSTIQVVKGNSLGGEPVQPGDQFDYQFSLTCSSINVDCVDFTFTDSFPPDVVVDESSLPESIPGVREVDWEPAPVQRLTITYLQPLDNPEGSGLQAGTSVNFDITVTVPEDTDLVTGDTIDNTAEVTAGNAPDDDSTTEVTVDVPRVVDPVTTKSWTDASAIAGSGETSTIVLGATNASSTSAEVTELAVGDLSPATWEHLDLTGVEVSAFPTGADTAQLLVCTAAASACPPAALEPGGTATAPGPADLSLPAGVDPSAVTGVQVVFSNADGSPIPRDTQGGGEVRIGTELRQTYRSTGEDMEPTEIIRIDNCASVAAVDEEQGSVAGDDACAPYQIYPSTLVLDPSKSFFPDTDGDFTQEAGEHAVIGENSGVSAVVSIVNDSPFPIGEIVVTEPSTSLENEWDKFDAETLDLRFPSGATEAEVTVTYEDGTTTTATYTSSQLLQLDASDTRVTSITVTYRGTDDDGNPTIAAGSTAGIGVHGTLNDLVTDDDLATGGSPGVTDCADVLGDAGRDDGTGTFAGSACATLVPEVPRDSMTGTKTNSQDEIIPGGWVLFEMSTTNNGNRPLYDVVVSDPPVLPDGTPDPAFPNVFDFASFDSATVTPAAIAAIAVIEVHHPGTGWVPVASADPDLVDGVRVRLTQPLLPSQSFTLRVGVVFDDPLSPDAAMSNCYVTDADSDIIEATDPWCGPQLDVGDVSAGATVNKYISPPELPQYVPGLPRQEATVTLRLANSGNAVQGLLRVTDDDADFFDAVDFVRFGAMTGPATAVSRADLLQVDALVGGAWVDGVPRPVGSPVLPGVSAGQVRGLRFTFTSSSPLNDGYVITPCDGDPCAGFVDFVVSPRRALVSDPSTPVPDELENTVDGEYTTQLTPDPQPIPEVTAGLDLVEGDHQIDVNKGPDNSTLAPGELRAFTLAVTNNGTNLIPDLTVVDPIPAGLVFDETYVGDGGQPFSVVVTDLPEGIDPPDAPTFTPVPDTADPSRVGQLRWTFEGWYMPVGTTVEITVRMSLAPGVTAGQVVTNTMGATSPVDDLRCTPPDAVVADGEYGDGTYCTDPASVTARAGAAFVARKWVAGNPDLGWYSPRAGNTIVPVGGGRCPSLTVGGTTYTSNPCVALVNPGEPYDYLLRVQNAGTEPASRMVIIDALPAPDDTGVLGGDRGTEWENRPTLAGPATYVGPTTGTLTYTSGTPCTADLTLGGPGCPADAWDDPADATTTALKLSASFEPSRLAPGAFVDVRFQMDTPTDVPQVSDPTVAWNSLAHAEATVTGTRGERILPPIEPIKVGVATTYGVLEVVKQIGDNPADVPAAGLTYEFTYECVLSDGETPGPTGTVTATVAEPGRVSGIPSGSTCRVWETGTNGGVPSATEDDPIVVEIQPNLPAQPAISSTSVTNDFPIGHVEVAKEVSGGARPEFTEGPFTIAVDCRFAGESLEGFPTEVDLAPDESEGFDVPVGTTCSIDETDLGGATTVTFDPESGSVVVPADGDQEATVTATNDFPVGSLVVMKDVTGPGAPAFSAGPFTFDVTCSFNGEADVFSTSVTVAGPTDGEPATSDPVEGLPVGATCTITETDAGGADVTPDPVEVTITDGEQGAVVASFVNPFSAGTVAVAKQVDGTAADSDYVVGLTFTIEVTCGVLLQDGSVGIVHEGSVTVTGDGEAVPVTDDGGEPVLLPAGARCWAAEPMTGGSTTTVIANDSFATGVPVEADPEAGLQELTLEVVNTFDSAAVAVAKTVINDPRPGQEFTFTIDCTIEDGGTTVEAPLLSGSSPFTLAGGETATFDVLVGSNCTVTETDAGGGDPSLVEAGTDGDGADGTFTVTAGVQVDVTNTFPAPPGPDVDGRPLGRTGSSVAGVAVLGAALIAAGTLLFRRRRLA